MEGEEHSVVCDNAVPRACAAPKKKVAPREHGVVLEDFVDWGVCFKHGRLNVLLNQ